jgi:hypothetical protein
MLIDPTIIATKLRITIVQLFEVCNQVLSLGYSYPAALPLAQQMENRLHSCIDNLGEIVKELEPKKVDTSSMSFDDGLVLAGYQEIKKGLLQSWQFIESRERAIIGQAGTRIPDQGRAAQ